MSDRRSAVGSRHCRRAVQAMVCSLCLTPLLAQDAEVIQFQPTPRTVLRVEGELRGVVPSTDLSSMLLVGAPEVSGLWDWRSKQHQQRMSDVSAALRGVAVSPGKDRVATLGADGRVGLWRFPDLQHEAWLQAHRTWCAAVAFHPERPLLATCGYDRRVTVWSVEQHQQLAEWTLNETPRALVWDGQGRLLVADRRGGLSVWQNAGDADSRPRHSEVSDTAIRALWPLADESLVAIGTADGRLLIWNSGERRLERELSQSPQIGGFASGVWNLAGSSDGRWLAAGRYDGRVEIWDPVNGRLVQDLGGSGEVLGGLAFAADSTALWAGDRDGRLLVWDLSLPLRQTLGAWPVEDTRVWEVAVRPGHPHAAIGGNRGYLELRSLTDGSQVRKFAGFDSGVDVLAFSPDGKRLAATGWRSESVLVWDVDSGETHATLEVENNLRSLAFSPDGRLLAMGTDGGAAIVWSFKDEARRGAVRVPAGYAEAVCFSPDGSRLVTGSGIWKNAEPGTVQVWDVDSLEEIRLLQGHTRVVRQVQYVDGGRLLASLDASGQLRLWSADDLQLLATLPCGGNARWFETRQQQLVVGLENGTALVWDLSSREPVARFGGGRDLFAVDFTDDGSLVLAADGQRRVLVWDRAAAQGEPSVGLVVPVREWLLSPAKLEMP